MKPQPGHIALIGNPNCGKSTLFNRLTGLRQKTSNLPGTTVEQKKGIWKSSLGQSSLIDLPGIYSIYTENEEEKIVVDHLLGEKNKIKPELLIFVLDAANLRRNLLLLHQVSELGFPGIVVLTMTDTAKRRGISIDIEKLSQSLNKPVCAVNPRTGEGLNSLETALQALQEWPKAETSQEKIEKLQFFHQGKQIRGLAEETLKRYTAIESIVKNSITLPGEKRKSLTSKFDFWVTHKISGFVIFGIIMLAIFQGVFMIAEYPMQWIEQLFQYSTVQLEKILPDNFFTDLTLNGILPGLAGVLVFLPQIAILFFFISLLEDSGYMVRASFITDKLMRKAGLNGRSVIPLIGGFACAIPSIMASRTIKNKRERLVTMFITPLMSCSARLPVYILLISLAVPANTKFGPIGMQSLLMTLAYFAGIILAIVIALGFKTKGGENSSEFILELPPYQLPRLRNVWIQVYNKSKSFVTEAGKIILIISIILWFLASYGPGDSIKNAGEQVEKKYALQKEKDDALIESEIEAAKLEVSYAGRMGKWIEPALEPLGYDWKTGIAIVSSFAAREVFVGTMSTLFNAGGEENITGIKEKMQTARHPETGKPLYGIPYALSLMVFYAFALQCVSTMAVMKRETGGWKWPLIQFFMFGGIAYVCALFTYRIALYLS